MITIALNGENHPLDNHVKNLDDLVQQLDLAGKRFAIEINEEIITRSEYKTCLLKNGDQVEIVQAIGGG